MAMELYGKGMILGPDFGRGPSYWTKSHGEFYTRYAAHNTVSVDGISDYNPIRANKVFEILAIEPTPSSHTALSEAYSFSDTEFTEPKTDARQRRLLAIVKPSESTGFYVDIFRSKRNDGKDKKHEYLYHNIGQRLTLTKTNGSAITLSPTSELSSASGDHKSYDYFTDKFSTSWDENFSARFDANVHKGKNVRMGLWMKDETGRTLFKANSPVARTLSKGSAPKELQDLTVPTLVVRQDGPAWEKPFVAIFEPYFETEGSSLVSIEPLQAQQAHPDFVGLKVTTRHDGIQYILNNTSDATATTAGDIHFSGTYAVISESTAGIQALYLGSGRSLSKGNIAIDGNGALVSASIEKVGDHYIYSSNNPITVTISGKAIDVPAAHKAKLKL